MPAIEIALPVFHPGQVEVFRNRGRLNAVRCGRRWGKTVMMVTLAADAAIKGRKVGIFAPEHKQLNEPYDDLLFRLAAVKRKANKNEGTIRTTTGGVIDFWTLDDNELAGRGREYDLILMDEIAFAKDSQMMNIWRKSIRPTMLTRPKHQVYAFSTPKSDNPENFFWQICNNPKMGFVQHYAPSSSNPDVGADELEYERQTNHPKVFEQEFLALFVDWSGDAFFNEDKMLVEKRPVPVPKRCDTVFAIVDTAIKDGKQHDGTAVSYFSYWQGGPQLVLLDWDIISIEGAFLEAWFPSVFNRLDELATETNAAMGSSGAWIEDKVSGTVLLQQARNRGWQARAIDGKITAQGKSERAINVSSYYHRGFFKISEPAYNKTTSYKGTVLNHWRAQVTGFRVGAKDGAADDLLDTATYGMAIAFGNREGY